jgi:hypothetical protein
LPSGCRVGNVNVALNSDPLLELSKVNISAQFDPVPVVDDSDRVVLIDEQVHDTVRGFTPPEPVKVNVSF